MLGCRDAHSETLRGQSREASWEQSTVARPLRGGLPRPLPGEASWQRRANCCAPIVETIAVTSWAAARAKRA
eukprot:7086087-Alexandrium_andersonii.AAC.1